MRDQFGNWLSALGDNDGLAGPFDFVEDGEAFRFELRRFDHPRRGCSSI
jgi:hypothetical protein